MVSTRLTPTCDSLGQLSSHRRCRVDPVKLLDLIERIKRASGSKTPAIAVVKSTAPAKVG